MNVKSVEQKGRAPFLLLCTYLIFDFDLSTVHSEGIRIRSVDNLASFRAIALQECGNPQDLSVE